MILCDTGPLVALIDKSEIDNQRRCREVMTRLRPLLITTWPCMTEAMYLLGERGGLPLQRLLWNLLDGRRLRIHAQNEDEVPRLRELMEIYHDIPMDFGDSSLVAAAEKLNISRIFTLDSHFYAYRINGRTPFEVIQ